MSSDFRTYLVVQLPGWTLAAVVIAIVSRWTSLPVWMGVAVFGLWVVKDLLLYPAMRRFYRPEPAERRIVGQRGTAVTPIGPRGFVRVQGELWQARSDQPISQGATIVVRDVEGLTLLVTCSHRDG